MATITVEERLKALEKRYGYHHYLATGKGYHEHLNSESISPPLSILEHKLVKNLVYDGQHVVDLVTIKPTKLQTLDLYLRERAPLTKDYMRKRLGLYNKLLRSEPLINLISIRRVSSSVAPPAFELSSLVGNVYVLFVHKQKQL